jgi:hypothetical protein
MKNLIKQYKTFLVIVCVLAMYSCKQSDDFIEPDAKMNIVNNNISLLEKLEVKNLGQGQKYTFWAGDAGHNYNLRSSGGNYGLAPNAGIDFNYYYLKAGEYTVYMIASSYDAVDDRFVQKIDSAKISVSGAAVNNFTSFAIQNAWVGYSPMGEIKNDSIFIKLAPLTRPFYSDTLLAYVVNMKPPLFSVAKNLDYATIYDENNNFYKGLGTDISQLNLFKIIDENNIEPIVKTFTIIDNATQNAHSYKVAAMFYPQMFSYSIEGDDALLFSENGLSQITDKNVINKHYLLHPDSIYLGVYLDMDQDIKNVTPTFNVTPNAVVTLNGVVQTSGVSKVDLTVQPIVYKITSNFGSFKITTKVAVNYSSF